MAGTNKSVLDKAESIARRLLQRLGAKVDSKLAPEDQQTLSPREVGELTAKVESVIEANLREDKNKIKRVAPNLFKILFTYEESTRLNRNYIEALANDLRATIYEYINNRRYEIAGGIKVETGHDLFAKSTVVRAGFEGDEDSQKPSPAPAATAGHSPGSPSPSTRRLVLAGPNGSSFRLELKAEGAPSYIGRVAGNAVRIDDASISRLHCSIALRSSGEVVVSDLGSSNGTFVNGRIINLNEAHPINEGDTILVGDIKFTVSELQ